MIPNAGPLITGVAVTDLSSLPWTVSSASYNISVPAVVPSLAHLDLYRANVIGDPYYGLNDFNLRWVTQSNWTYATTLNLQGNSNSTWLLFHGLDTFTNIELCGTHVASTNNQFRQYYFDVTSILASCNSHPTLSINFGNAAAIAENIALKPGQETWPEGVEGVFEYRHRQFVRKEQSDFGWDWGPAFVPAGPWQPAFAVQLGESNVFVRNSHIDIYRQGQLNLVPPDQTKPWILNASLDTVGDIPLDASLMYHLVDVNGTSIRSGLLSGATRSRNSISASTVIPSDSVSLWWPHGFGEQHLYNVQLALIRSSNFGTIANLTKKIGFRTIVLNQEPIRPDQLAQGIAPGNNWHFEINGREFYAKGSNFIPPDAFWPRVTKDRMKKLFNSVVDGNQNMLRVWASGAYLPDFIYDLADEMGIMLWSEFQFGDALYPVDAEFLDNVREEANYQVRRINHHPSLALWAGGNELENLELPTARRGAPQEFDRYLAEYEKLFLDALVPCVFENSKSISYTPSSTSNGWLSLNFSNPQPIKQRYDLTTPGSIYGETDYYNYDSSGAFIFESYPVGRFSNEFGYHSMPSIQTWRQAVSPDDLYFNSTVIRSRNHHYPSGGLNRSNLEPSDRGMAEMVLAARRWYPVPNKIDPAANFSAWCHTTQVFQADFYSSQIQFYRRGSGMPERQLGSLYWQLEDIWQAPTWAGIEYDGRWKVLHYAAKDKYKNVIISPFLNREHILEVYVTSDLWSSVTGSANFSWYDWNGTKLQVDTPSAVVVNVGAINSTRVLQANVTEVLQTFDPTNAVLLMETTIQGILPNENTPQQFHHQNWFHPARLSAAKLVDPGLRLHYSKATKRFTIEATKGIAAWVWLDYPAGALVNFDMNAFWLLPGRPVDVGYHVVSDETSGAWIDQVTVRSLWDNNLP